MCDSYRVRAHMKEKAMCMTHACTQRPHGQGHPDAKGQPETSGGSDVGARDMSVDKGCCMGRAQRLAS
jgi:hypothetical protein